MSDYLKPKAPSPKKFNNPMENGMFRNPPTFTSLGGFTSASKYTDPAGKRNSIGGPSLERGGPTAQKGKPI